MPNEMSDAEAIHVVDQTEGFIRNELIPVVLEHWAEDRCTCRTWMCPGPDVIASMSQATPAQLHNVFTTMLGMLAKTEQEKVAHK